MKTRRLIDTLTALSAAAALLSMFACAAGTGIARRHPEKLETLPVCVDCHDAGYSAYDHTRVFRKEHGYPARREERVCAACHRASFCADCHGDKEELKPSDKFRDYPARESPHRGDYLSRHRIDGRINPVPCFGCHGRKNEWRCRQCHK